MKIFRMLSMALFAVSFCANAAAPAAYYDDAENKNQRDLLIALNGIIANHTTLSYSSLWDHYKDTDVYSDGTIWDMYSTIHWSASKKCGTYSVVGDCYNREHSFPKSWFKENSPMVSDIMHIYPTDGRVNGQRSNYPYGECANGTTLSATGGVKALGKLGKSTFSGYSGTVFEPDDQYKGDFARTYFYMAACYYSQTASWKSDMLAGNNYPLFKEWAINLLLKWHRQDCVSDKEIARNEAVYKKQRNRNPFIDHPELVEYIWGDKKNEYWTANGVAKTEIITPVNGSSIDLGVTAVNVEMSKTIVLRTSAVTENVTLSATAPFAVSTTSVSADDANKGVSVVVYYRPTEVNKDNGTLTISVADVVSKIDLKGSCVEGMPVSDASQISEDSFTANWTFIGDADADDCYTLDVTDDEGSIDGYPRKVNAAAGYYRVDGLMPLTDYYYTVSSNSLTSKVIAVTTGAPVPLVEFLYDGDLVFTTTPGTPSEAAELLVDIANIESDITISVVAPFELSLDLSNWATSITITPDEDRIYMRLNSEKAGSFETSIVATVGDYYADDSYVCGEVTDETTFFEDFEATGDYDTYNAQTYIGTACTWSFKDAGIWPSDNEGHSGVQAVRMGKTASSSIEMTSDRVIGISTISFYAKKWTANEADAKVTVEVSTDKGETWKSIGEVTVTNASSWQEFTFTAGVANNARMRLRQTSGKRFFIDDISLTDSSTGLSDPSADRHQWNAYSIDGNVCVDVDAAKGIDVAIYSVDGITIFAGHLECGKHTFDNVATGSIVIAHSGEFSRTILVR